MSHTDYASHIHSAGYDAADRAPGSLLNKGLYFVNFMLGKNLDTSTKAVEVWNVLSFKIELNDWEKDRLWSLEIDSVLRPDLKWKSERIS